MELQFDFHAPLHMTSHIVLLEQDHILGALVSMQRDKLQSLWGVLFILG